MKDPRLLLIDPGVVCGVAIHENGKLNILKSGDPALPIAEMARGGFDAVVIEDARLQSHVWRGYGASANKLKALGSDVGINRGIGLTIIACAAAGGARVIAVSPKDKGSKVKAARFEEVTQWREQSNQHERDAAMLVYTFACRRFVQDFRKSHA